MFLNFIRSQIGRGTSIFLFVLAGSAAALAGVTVSSPSDHATVSSPVHVVAYATSSTSASITYMRIYLDYNSVYAASAHSIDTYLNMGTGTHSLIVQAWDGYGNVYKTYRTVYVGSSSSSSGGGSGSTGTTIYNIDQMTGWETCSRCAGAYGDGPSVPHYITYGISSPSMDGRSVQFTNAGTVAYSNAIWWKQLGADGGKSHFIYDLYFYVKTPSAAIALEFDVNQSTGGRKYIFGTQCGVNYDHQWDVWASGWKPTGVGCSINAYSWNHLTAEFYRSNGMVHYVSITLNGKKSYINRSYGSLSSGSNEINVAFQSDQTASHTTFNVWLDKIKLTKW